MSILVTALSTDGQNVTKGHSELREDRAGYFSWSVFLVHFNTHHLPPPTACPDLSYQSHSHTWSPFP